MNQWINEPMNQSTNESMADSERTMNIIETTSLTKTYGTNGVAVHALRGIDLGHDEIGDDLALRRQQRAKPRRSGRELENVGGHKPMQKAPRAVTGDFDHATVGKQGSLHGKKLSKYCQRT